MQPQRQSASIDHEQLRKSNTSAKNSRDKKPRPYSSSTTNNHKNSRYKNQTSTSLNKSAVKTSSNQNQSMRLSLKNILQDSCQLEQNMQPAPTVTRASRMTHHKQTSNNKARPFTHATPPKLYRINQQDVYNYVRNSVHETFKTKQSRNYELIKQMTDSKNSTNSKKIDRLCEKYSIIKNNSNAKRMSFEDSVVGINVEEITHRYVKSRSKQKQKFENRERLRKDIAENYRYGRKKQYQECQQFFSLEGSDLKKLQKKFDDEKKRIYIEGENRENKNGKSKSKNSIYERYSTTASSTKHPYIEMYEKAQMEALVNLSENKTLTLDVGDYPPYPEPEQWQKNTQNFHKIFSGANLMKKKREIQSARPRGSKQEQKASSFFLT